MRKSVYLILLIFIFLSSFASASRWPFDDPLYEGTSNNLLNPSKELKSLDLDLRSLADARNLGDKAIEHGALSHSYNVLDEAAKLAEEKYEKSLRDLEVLKKEMAAAKKLFDETFSGLDSDNYELAKWRHDSLLRESKDLGNKAQEARKAANSVGSKLKKLGLEMEELYKKLGIDFSKYKSEVSGKFDDINRRMILATEKAMQKSGVKGVSMLMNKFSKRAIGVGGFLLVAVPIAGQVSAGDYSGAAYETFVQSVYSVPAAGWMAGASIESVVFLFEYDPKKAEEEMRPILEELYRIRWEQYKEKLNQEVPSDPNAFFVRQVEIRQLKAELLIQGVQGGSMDGINPALLNNFDRMGRGVLATDPINMDDFNNPQ